MTKAKSKAKPRYVLGVGRVITGEMEPVFYVGYCTVEISSRDIFDKLSKKMGIDKNVWRKCRLVLEEV